MNGYTLLISVVPHNKAEFISDAAVSAGSFGGTVLMGRRISSSPVMAALGLGESTRDVVMILAQNSTKENISRAIKEAAGSERAGFGVLIETGASQMLKTGTITGGTEQMSQNCKKELITVILNKGYADDAMAAARKAGAGGGTVINARGTAREDDAKFFGMHIVPEKEMLMIVVDEDKKDAVLEAVRSLDCLSVPGSGIAFSSSVNEFSLLGKA